MSINTNTNTHQPSSIFSIRRYTYTARFIGTISSIVVVVAIVLVLIYTTGNPRYIDIHRRRYASRYTIYYIYTSTYTHRITSQHIHIYQNCILFTCIPTYIYLHIYNQSILTYIHSVKYIKWLVYMLTLVYYTVM